MTSEIKLWIRFYSALIQGAVTVKPSHKKTYSQGNFINSKDQNFGFIFFIYNCKHDLLRF